MSRLALVLLTYAAAATALTATAHAESISVSVGADPTEEVPLPVTATWNAPSAQNSPAVIVTAKPAGATNCQANYRADDPLSEDVLRPSFSDPKTGSRVANFDTSDPGSWVLCAYLQNSSSDTVPLATAGPIPVTFRAGTGTIAVQLPARVDPGQRINIPVPVTSELPRQVFLTSKPAGGRGCEGTYTLDDPISSDVSTGQNVQGTQTVTATWTAPTGANGTYLLCAYLQESRSSTATVAISQATVLVGPDPCLTAKSQLRSANQKVKTEEKSVNRNRSAYKRYKKQANRLKGRKRKAKQRLARRAHSRYKSAIRRRAKARGNLAAAQARVTSACPGG